MATNNNNLPIVEEQVIIEQTEQETIVEQRTEQQIIQELLEQVRVLKIENEELGENLEKAREDYDKRDKTVWEYYRTLRDDNKETELVAVLEKRKQIKDLKGELTQKDQELAQKDSQISSLQSQVSSLSSVYNHYNQMRQKIDDFKRRHVGTDNYWCSWFLLNWFNSPNQIIEERRYTFQLPHDFSRETIENICRSIKAMSEAKNLLSDLS